MQACVLVRKCIRLAEHVSVRTHESRHALGRKKKKKNGGGEEKTHGCKLPLCASVCMCCIAVDATLQLVGAFKSGILLITAL